MKDYIKRKIKEWLGSNTVASIENNGSMCINIQLSDELDQSGNGVIISIVFSKYQHNKISRTIVMEDDTHAKGMVLALPSYWFIVPFDLLIQLFDNYITDFLDNRNNYNDDEEFDNNISNPDDLDPNFNIPDKCPIL